ncbi:fosmidomycin resistance protein [Acidobacteria bacterium Mor1]|nr:fosmidomycin resistance protein [Acidobacteria bacterium Mor1]
MIQGLSHLTFVVRDLDAMGRILVDVLGARRVYASGDRTFSRSPEAFYELAGLWIAVMQGEPLSEKSYDHVAFKIEEADFDGYVEKIRTAGLEFEPPRSRVDGEGRSIYFYDHDRHLFELHTGTLDERLERYRRGPGRDELG